MTLSHLQSSDATIGEFFFAMGLSIDDIHEMQEAIRLNTLNIRNHIPSSITLTDPVHKLKLSQLAYVGRSIANRKGRLFLDLQQKLPLTEPVNAMHYGYQQLELFSNKKAPKGA